MTGGQTNLLLGADDAGVDGGGQAGAIRRLSAQRAPLPVIAASELELDLHRKKLEVIDKASDGAVWLSENS